MKITDDHENSPLCRFGPGGDYTSLWPTANDASEPREGSSLTALLKSLGELVALCMGAPVGSLQAGRSDARSLIARIRFPKERINNVKSDSTATRSSDAATNASAQIHRQHQAKQMLLPYDGGTGKQAGSQPKHRVRAHRGASKKRAAVGFTGQGTLFDSDTRSARTA